MENENLTPEVIDCFMEKNKKYLLSTTNLTKSKEENEKILNFFQWNFDEKICFLYEKLPQMKEIQIPNDIYHISKQTLNLTSEELDVEFIQLMEKLGLQIFSENYVVNTQKLYKFLQKFKHTPFVKKFRKENRNSKKRTTLRNR